MSPRGCITITNPETGKETVHTADDVLSAKLNRWSKLTENERDSLKKSIEQTTASGRFPSLEDDLRVLWEIEHPDTPYPLDENLPEN